MAGGNVIAALAHYGALVRQSCRMGNAPKGDYNGYLAITAFDYDTRAA